MEATDLILLAGGTAWLLAMIWAAWELAGLFVCLAVVAFMLATGMVGDGDE